MPFAGFFNFRFYIDALPTSIEKDHEVVREEARDLMLQIQEKCVEYDPDRKVRIPYSLPFFIRPRPRSSHLTSLCSSRISYPQLLPTHSLSSIFLNPSVSINSPNHFHFHFPYKMMLTPSPAPQLSIIVEFIAGRVTQTLDRLIALYRPDSLVVGTRGQRTVMHALGMAGLSGSACSFFLSFPPSLPLLSFLSLFFISPPPSVTSTKAS